MSASGVAGGDGGDCGDGGDGGDGSADAALEAWVLPNQPPPNPRRESSSWLT